MTRDEFRNAVFTRDHHLCVVCKAPGQDAHHIMERRLFPCGGYDVDNGATLCGPCHIKAENNRYWPHDIRGFAGIRTCVLPPHLYRDTPYDKWGNVIVNEDTGEIAPGELYYDPSVQKILHSRPFEEWPEYVKYPRTSHLYDSPGMTDDDRKIEDLDTLQLGEIVVTEKMDGENTTMYRDFVHARSLNGLNHPSQSWMKQFHASIGHLIPEGMRICGENMYATHSIKYEALPAYFLMFSAWERDRCLSWDETVEWAQLLGLSTVKVLYRGKWNQTWEDYRPILNYPRACCEGYVVRVAGEFRLKEFPVAVAKYVRANHVQSSHNWRNRWNGETNELKASNELV